MMPMMILALVGASFFAVAFNQIDYTGNSDDEDGGGPDDTGEDMDTGAGGGTITPDDGESLTGGVTDSGNSDDDLGLLTVAAGEQLLGTDGNDTIVLEGDADAPLQVDAQRGNDVIDLYDLDTIQSEEDFRAQQLDTSLIDGGFGNDAIDTAARGSTIMGNLGNDTITGTYESSEVDGGIGNDLIDVTDTDGGTTILGGDGADTITAAMEGGRIDGGAGNDRIDVFTGQPVATEADGGHGNDFFRIDATDLPVDSGTAGVSVTGGQGIDIFELTVNEGGPDATGWTGAQVSTLPDGTIRVDLGEISDFTPSEDLLVISGLPASDGFTLSSVVAEEEVEGEGAEAVYSTHVRVTYTAEGLPNREMVINLPGAELLDNQDIQLVGVDGSLLEVYNLTRDTGGALAA